MMLESRRRFLVPIALLTMLALSSACAARPGTSGESSPNPQSTAAPTATTTTTTAAAPSATASPQTKAWFDLDVGDCLADPPPVDPNVIAVTIVDCATAHQAEVYLRTPMAVNTALADVADRECSAGFTEYTGQQAVSSTFSTTYLIDSNQNRTSSNPNPSAVICLVQSADGRPLTGSARR